MLLSTENEIDGCLHLKRFFTFLRTN